MGGCVTANSKPTSAPLEALTARIHDHQPTMDIDTGNDNIFRQSACGYGFGFEDDLQKRKQIQEKKILLQRIKEMLDLYNEHKIDLSAAQAKYVLQNLKKLNLAEHPELPQNLQNLMNQLLKEHQDVLAFESQISRGGWIFKSQNKSGIRISSRREEGTVGVLVQAEIDVQVEKFLAVVTEVDLMKNFVPFVEQSRCQKIVTRNCRIGFTLNNFPILSKRQAFFQGIGYNRLNHNNSILLYTRSIHNRPDLQQVLSYTPMTNVNNIQIQYKYLVVRYEPIHQKRGKVTMAINVDMKLHFLPLALMDFSCRQFGQQFFGNIVKISENFKDSLWEKNVQKNSELFDFFRKAIDDYMRQKQKKQRKQKKDLKINEK